MMKLELTLPALERLIGGDTELEVSLRRGIVEEFCKRHLREFANDELMKAAVETTKQFVNAVAKEAIDIENIATSHLWPTVGSRLKSLMEGMVKESAQKAVDEALLNMVKWQKHDWSKWASAEIKRHVEEHIAKEVEAEIKRRMDAARDLSRDLK